ncbi:uncharacterized protein LOC111871340 isoform X2 [Cryptotermes secundus]|nr:uncharacterized protein LOC111871340 isoform X2 [Cryptotermes secundus]XP_023720161.1 uncharacterized protein LOC111871340 isoform X2 [Cryptotermes secundus]
MNYALNTFTCRQVGLTGSVIYFCGSFLTAFATNVYQIIFTYGIMQGIGLGLMVPAAFTSFNHYFVRRRTFAMAVTQMIIGGAAMVVPLAIQMLLEEYGFRGTQAIIAAFSLHAMLGMVVQQPVKYHIKRKKHSIPLSSDFTPRPSADIIVHGEGTWHADIEKSSEVNIRIQQHRSEMGEDSEVNIKINKQHSELKATNRNRAISQELINIQFQNKNMCVDNSDGKESLGILGEVKDAGRSKESMETETDKQKNEHDSAQKVGEHVDSESNVSDEHKFLMQSGHSKKYGHVEQVTAEIGITVKRADPASVTRMPKSRSQVSVPVTDKIKDVYRTRYDSIRDAPSLGSTESQDGCDRCWTSVVNFLDLRLLLDPVYVNISVGISFSLICMLQFFAFYPILVLDLGYSKSDTAIFIAVCNAMDLAGRLVIALIGILNPNFTSRSLFMVGTVTTVAGRLMLILFNDFLAVALMTGFLGFARSFIQVPLPLVFAEYNLERFPSAFGLYSVIFGLIAVMVGPFIGLVRDVTNSYPACINTLNGLTVFACIIPWLAEHAVVHMRSKSNKREGS